MAVSITPVPINYQLTIQLRTALAAAGWLIRRQHRTEKIAASGEPRQVVWLLSVAPRRFRHRRGNAARRARAVRPRRRATNMSNFSERNGASGGKSVQPLLSFTELSTAGLLAPIVQPGGEIHVYLWNNEILVWRAFTNTHSPPSRRPGRDSGAVCDAVVLAH